MAGNGPPPKEASQRARRNAGVAMTKLQADGRKGKPMPKWPLAGDVQLDTDIELAKLEIKDIDDEIAWRSTARERAALRRRADRIRKKIRQLEAMRKAATRAEQEIWKSLWTLPQAVQWAKRGWYREVALYARHQAKAEAGSLDDSKEARQREDRLGLNDQAMLRLRWEIVDTAAAATGPRRRSTRNTKKYGDLRVVGG